ncbi:hypothetical protein SUDANB2_04193 [Streptomyces sp. enrichment culture]
METATHTPVRISGEGSPRTRAKGPALDTRERARPGHAKGLPQAREGARLPTEAGPHARGDAQRTKTPACPARSRKYCGATPSTSVTATPTPIAVMVNGDGTATVGPSGRGSLKNISTMTRM